MTISVDKAKARLNGILKKQRTDFYKPIHIAEVLHRSRVFSDITIANLEDFRLSSIKWGSEVTIRLTGKKTTSSAGFMRDMWSESYMPPAYLSILDEENKKTGGSVERYIYLTYAQNQNVVSEVIAAVEVAVPEEFSLRALLDMFDAKPGLRRSIDKAYEIVAYSLFETLVTTLEARVRVSVPPSSADLLDEFSDIAVVLLGLVPGHTEWEQDAHIYRVGVTNAADRGLDMFANFGPVIQVKHLTLNDKLAVQIVDQVESDSIVVVCRDAEAQVLQAIMRQIGWGRRVRGIITESDLIRWYERCLKGKFANRLATSLMSQLADGFKAEFPPSNAITSFLEERGYTTLPPPDNWRTEVDNILL